MNCLKLNMKEKPRCTTATKTVWASPFHTSAPNSHSERGAKSGGRARRLQRVDTYPLKPVHVDHSLLFDKNDSGASAVFPSEQCLTSSKNAMEQEEEKKDRGKEMQTKWEARAPRSYLISINGFTGDPRDPRKSLRGGFS